MESQPARRYPYVDAECNAIPHYPAHANVHSHTPGYFLNLHCVVCRQTWRCGGRSKCEDNLVLMDKYSFELVSTTEWHDQKHLLSSARFLLVGHLAIFTMTGDDIKKDVGDELQCDTLDGVDVDIPDRARKEKALLRRVDSRMMPLMMILCKLSLDHIAIGAQTANLSLT